MRAIHDSFARLSARRRALILAAASAALGASQLASAQVSGSWIVDSDGNWSTGSNWSSNPNFPTGGGVATFGTLPNSTIGHYVLLDTNVSLSGITFSNPFPFTIDIFNGGETITLVGGANINVTDGPSVPNPVPVLTPYHTIATPIAGSVGLNKTGSGAVLLGNQNNTFTGGVNISGGTLFVIDQRTGSLGNAANVITLSNGAALANTTSNPNLSPNFTTNRSITLGTGGGELRNYANMTLTGVISGGGNLTKRIGTGSLTLQGANTYTGSTTIRDEGVIVLSQNGSIASSSAYNIAGTLVMDNLAIANSNRIGNAAIDLNGGSIQFVGNNSTNVNESTGAISLDGGQSVFNLVGTGAATQLNGLAMTRIGKSTALLRGDALGAGSGAGFTNLTLNVAPAQVGGGGAPGSTNISIVPWLVGNRASGNTLNAADNTLVTYGGVNGFRPLDPINEFAPLAGAGATTNVAITAPTNVAASQTINSLVLRGQPLNAAGGALTINSGAVLVSVAGGTYSAPLNFGSTEAIFHTTSSGTFSGAISGTNGLTKSGANQLVLTGANTYTGQTSLVAGTLRVQSDVLATGVAGPLGQSTGAILMQGGVGITVPRFYALMNGTNVKLDRALTLNNATADSIGAVGTAVGSTAGNTFTVNGAIVVNGGTLRLEGDSNAASPALVVNGAIAGTGRVTDAFGSAQVLSGNNTYTGGTTISAGTYFAGSNTAFGAGSITFANTTSPSVSNPLPGAIGAFGAPRTISNPILATSFGPFDTNDGAMRGVGIVGNQPLTLSGPIDLGGGSARWFTVNNTATTTFSGVLSRGGLEKAGTGRLVLTGTNTYTGDTSVHSGTLTFGATQSNTALFIDSGARAELAPNGNRILVVRSLNLAGGAAPTATLDLFDNDLKIANGSVSTVRAQIASAYDFGAWDGQGITSTSARNDAIGNKTLGLLTGNEYFNNNGDTQFDGFAVSANDILVKYTYYGDVDFNGSIDASDYNLIDFGFVSHLTGWANGDADYSGSVDVSDYNLIDFAFSTQGGTVLRAIQYLDGSDRSMNGMGEPSLQKVAEHFEQFGETYASGFLAAVPEPTSLGCVAIAAGVMLSRRRRARGADRGRSV